MTKLNHGLAILRDRQAFNPKASTRIVKPFHQQRQTNRGRFGKVFG